MRAENGIVIVVCRNTLELTYRCLPTLLALEGSPMVIVIDNASTDGTAAWLRSQSSLNPALRVGSYPSVQSLSALWNDALLAAFRGYGAEEALVVNNDTELRPETYQTLKRYLSQEERVGMVTAVGVGDREQFESPIEISFRPHPDFSCFMMAKWAWEETGGFDEGYKGAFYEDCDLHIRMYRAGIKAVSCGVPFLHYSSGTLKKSDPAERKRIEANYAANKARFVAQYGCVPGTKAYERLFLRDTTPTSRT